MNEVCCQFIEIDGCIVFFKTNVYLHVYVVKSPIYLIIVLAGCVLVHGLIMVREQAVSMHVIVTRQPSKRGL